MDTKSKSISYSLWTKGLCLFLITALIAISSYNLASAFRVLLFYGNTGALTGKIPAFEETAEFRGLFWEEINAVSRLTTDVQAANDAFKGTKKTSVTEAVNKYLEKKAEIIKGELLYAARSDYSGFSGNKDNLYDESRGEYRDDASLSKYRQIIAKLEKNDSDSAFVTQTDRNAPPNIYAAQLIVNHIKDLEYLQYESCVRVDALQNGSSYLSDGSSIEIKAGGAEYPMVYDSNITDFSYSEKEAAGLFSKEYDTMVSNYTQDMQSSIDYNQALLNSTVNFKYFVKNNLTGETAGNAGSAESSLSGKYRFAMVNGVIREDKTGSLSGSKASSLFTGAKDFTVYFWLESTLKPGDSYYTLHSFYANTLNNSVNREIAFGAAAFLLGMAAFVVFMCLSGHKNGIEGIAIAWIDRLPWDIHFIASGGVCTGLASGFIAATASLLSAGSHQNHWSDTENLELIFSFWFPAAAAVICAAIGLILIELIASAVRVNKAGKPWVKKFAVVLLILWLFRCLATVYRLIVKSFTSLFRVFKYKPKKLKKLAILFIVLYTFANVVTILLCFASPVFVLFVIGLNAAAIYFAANYARNLDKVITASVERSEFVPEGEVPPSLAMLANSLSYTNAELNRAINKAVKDERMKTELITNVSHDLKTPLTSVITYIDLLKKLGIDNDDAQKYITVLEEKAEKLKQLIEDLIEASKVSTGNVVLNSVNLNLAELTAQAVVEATADFEKNGLEIRFDEPEKAPVVFADSQKTYRILENLLSNARKYSAPGTRVYIRIYESGGSGIFEIKNISKEPLNISPEELTERFVRGDRSRSEEGNGLGLSIAKELAALQNGRLEISIDGDLFKAEVILPAGK